MHATAASGAPPTDWNPSYELKAVALLSIGFGLVGLDRFIINPLFPVMAKDLGLNYQDLGLISAVLALTWGLSSLFTGRLSDRVGQKRVLIPAVVIFSLLVATSGLATGLVSLLAIRGLMGLAEGAYVPASIVATAQASKPSRLGLNIGIQQMAAPLLGLGLGPVIAVALLKVLPGWEWVFAVVAIPGLIVAMLMWKVLRDRQQGMPAPAAATTLPIPPSTENSQVTPWWEVLRYRNVVFNTLGMFCYLTCLMVIAAFMPNYLTDHLKLGLDPMGMVLAGQGVGSLVGMVLLPALSDRFGRKPVMVLALAVEVVALWLLPDIGAEPPKLFVALFVITFMNAGVVAITVGPLTSTSVPAHLATTATGIVVGLGEIVGGALAPALAGAMAQRMGIPVVLTIALAAAIAGFLIATFLVREPSVTSVPVTAKP